MYDRNGMNNKPRMLPIFNAGSLCACFQDLLFCDE